MSKHIVFVGESGFPVGFAAIQRITLIAKAFIHVSCRSMVICRKGVGKKSEKIDFSKSGQYEGIDYIYTSKDVFRPKDFIERNVQKLMGLYGELFYLRKLKKNNEIDLVIVSEMSLFHMLRYLVYSKLLYFPIVVNMVEMASSMQHRNRLFLRINDYLIDNWALRMFDGALPISEKLMDHYRKISPLKPCLKLPILCDFDKFAINRKNAEPYFLYCGSIGYNQVINFVVDSFKKVCVKTDIWLYMIVSGGSKDQTILLERQISNRLGNKDWKLFSNIPYDQLIDLYVNAQALLIPLRPTVQDASRFPHKIGEYLATGNPVITTNIGEVKSYFQDKKTALVADSYKQHLFVEKMSYVLNHPESSKKIGLNGRSLGLEKFDYKAHGKTLQKFVGRFSD